ncbi:cytochrome c biogenesis protein ResB [Auraticoccus sp. F435]|uniref:Cytochrome c biogenesis protein ResB n=1 Tax=Auraticoccus cholistanensis TaxID=2656650 RepID=A0A6A9UWD7_9ACTN|nr:cytochrome c biogenesis protein ResB [Auraticoccus cholistanensis]MVA77028.1 cytochrome c biogenesis protein ResB [Auraticoccus cholistanensis]
MRTALTLLMVLAVAAIPGALLPQRPNQPFEVEAWIEQRPTLGGLYDAVGLFDVYASPWFAAIYLLLFVSLIGCIVPRTRVYWRALRAQPPRTPRNLGRLPASARATSSRPAAEVLEQAAARLRSRRFRVVVREDSVAAERGYLREAGNLVFHLSLVVMLVGLAVGALGGYRGSVVLPVGQSFANTISQYDDITAGGRFDPTSLPPFAITVEEFVAEFETGPVQQGAARVFRADLQVTEAPGEQPYDYTLEVNRPLVVEGVDVHLIQHGYAPVVTVRDGNGDVAFSGAVPFLPQDGNFTSAGAIKAPDARPEQLAFQGFFLPTAAVDELGPRSLFPDAFAPELFLNAWYGPPREESGVPENVYSLDVTGLEQMTTEDGSDSLRLRLAPGESVELPDGRGSITMDGWERWVKLQISDTPGLGVTLGSVVAAVLGLCLSLFVRPRRIWVRARTTPDGGTAVEVGGLDRADARTGLEEDVEELAGHLGEEHDTARTVPVGSGEDGS